MIQISRLRWIKKEVTPLMLRLLQPPLLLQRYSEKCNRNRRPGSVEKKYGESSTTELLQHAAKKVAYLFVNHSSTIIRGISLTLEEEFLVVKDSTRASEPLREACL
ncbi:unnamed protein product [Fraxinus pennsylvanica]|uniref:Uncharacterized protein n=1 Tax=Fraxinus pennsylvanica TaxID=56036 RepID=A0AAD2EDB7_9LAMI|nr:unnamed protein product [Fraxinus pennsylvanica]